MGCGSSTKSKVEPFKETDPPSRSGSRPPSATTSSKQNNTININKDELQKKLENVKKESIKPEPKSETLLKNDNGPRISIKQMEVVLPNSILPDLSDNKSVSSLEPSEQSSNEDLNTGSKSDTGSNREETEVVPFKASDSISTKDNESINDKDTPTKLNTEEDVDNTVKNTENTPKFDSKITRIYSTTTEPNEIRNKLTILHFNDVYNIEPRDKDPVGGAARFVTKIKSFPDEPLIVFSGDCLNPSIMSTVTKGKQMIPVMNTIGVHAAVYGNHDFDFGVDELIDFKNKTNFPWLMSNVKDKLTKTLLAEGIEKVVATWHGRKIGIIGLVEREWLVTLSTIDPEDVDYTDFIEKAEELVKQLREEEGCEYIIALTHMRVPNDMKLLESSVDLNLVLGGHDHHYETKEHESKIFVKSGTDFREFTELEIDFTTEIDGRPLVTTKRHEITKNLEEDPFIKSGLEQYSEILGEKMEEVLGEMQVDLDGRFSTVRTQESNLGNFICDIMRAASQTDIAFLNSGSLRSDTIHSAGPFKMKDLVTILPMVDQLVVIKVKGSILLEVLENSVCEFPKYEGRFLQVSGVTFVFDAEKAPGERIVKDSVKVHDAIPLDVDKEYTVVTKEYLSRGKDGYDMLAKCEVVVDAEDGPILNTIVENHFKSIKIYKGRSVSRSGHRQSITVKHDEVQSFMEMQRSKLAPKVEGRICKIGEEVKLSPSFLRRKSKLRVRTETVQSSTSLDKVQEEQDGGETTTVSVIEEIEEDDSDIDNVMESDTTREPISDDDRLTLWEACTIDDIDKVKSIINGRTLDYKFWIMEKTLLHHTTQHNSIKCLEYLLSETNLKVDVRDQILKSTALFYAAEHGSKEAANLLLDNNAKVNAKNALWEIPLHVACENGQGDMIILLLSRGADRTVKNKEGERPKI